LGRWALESSEKGKQRQKQTDDGDERKYGEQVEQRVVSRGEWMQTPEVEVGDDDVVEAVARRKIVGPAER
jgi:hypothetical protein